MTSGGRGMVAQAARRAQKARRIRTGAGDAQAKSQEGANAVLPATGGEPVLSTPEGVEERVGAGTSRSCSPVSWLWALAARRRRIARAAAAVTDCGRCGRE